LYLTFIVLVAESHDIALALQHKIEELDDVERAFVHVDHLLRDGLEHKVERQLYNSSSNPISSYASKSENDISPTSIGLRERSRGRSLANINSESNTNI
jgi:hypothetical protein